jgi:hypothetical protein
MAKDLREPDPLDPPPVSPLLPPELVRIAEEMQARAEALKQQKAAEKK